MKRSTTVLSTFFLSLAGISQAYAERADQPGFIEEVVVTATYRETNLMETPQAISAITDDFVEDIGAQSMEELFTLIPGLTMSGAVNGQARYTIRGITSQGGNVGYAPAGATTGVYIDGTPVTAALGPDNQVSGTLFDIDRVEVLKGPQGTLFGEGSQSGTIRFLYKQPDPTEFDAAVNVSYATMEESDDNSHRLDAMVNIPLSDNVAVRLTGWTAETAGFIDNLTPLEEDFNTGEAQGVRAAIRFEGDSYDIVASVHHSEQETTGGLGTFRAYDAKNGRIPGLEPESLDETDIFSLAVEWDLGFATLQSQTSYIDREISGIAESSEVQASILDYFYAGSTEADPNEPGCIAAAAFDLCPGFIGLFNFGGPVFTPDGNNLRAINSLDNSYSERWVQELRLVSPGDKRLRWTAGLFWKDSEDRTGLSNVAGYFSGREAFGTAFDPLLMVPANMHTDFLEEYAVFGEVSYDFLESLELTVGVRVSDIKQDFTNTSQGTDDTPVSPKLTLAWTPLDNLLLYFTHATGFRPGNVSNNMEFYAQQFILQRDAATDPAVIAELDAGIASFRSNLFFDGDEVRSYELGVKTALWDGRVSILGSIYQLDWDDMIVHESHPLNGDIYNANSGGADIQGLELEMTAFIFEGLSVRIAGDLNDTEVMQASALADAADGNELIYSPNKSLSVALDYSLAAFDGWSLDFHVDRSWVDEQFVDSANTVKIPSYKRTNARITMRSTDQKYRVALYGNNLSNDEILRGSDTAGTQYWHNPRQIGLEFGYDFQP